LSFNYLLCFLTECGKDFSGCRIDKQAIERLRHVADTPFKRISYTEAIELLKEAVKRGQKFEEMEIEWGMDMASEHERCASFADSSGQMRFNVRAVNIIYRAFSLENFLPRCCS
jgi:aspartyl/asparaginyl-tRNA synthetase